MTSQNKTYYEILGVSEDATFEEIRASFRERAREYHPDRNPSPDAVERMQEINEAWEVLRDANLRAAYDQERQSRSQDEAHQSAREQNDTSGMYTDARPIRSSVMATLSILHPCPSLALGVILLLDADALEWVPFLHDIEYASLVLGFILFGYGAIAFGERWMNTGGITRGVGILGIFGVLVLGGLVYDSPTTAESSNELDESSSELSEGELWIQAMNSLTVGDCVDRDESFELVSCEMPGAYRIEAVKSYVEAEGLPNDEQVRADTAALCPSTTTTILRPTDELWDWGFRLLVCLSEESSSDPT